jgi:penicillin amidase
MDRDSKAALHFDFIWRAYREELYADAFENRGLTDETYWPADWITATLPAEAEWFTVIDRSREAVLRSAIDRGRTRLNETGFERYGELNTVDLAHPLQQAFLGYPPVPSAGSSATLFNVHRNGPHGSSWRMVVESGSDAQGILPGGNSGDYFDAHYRDQLSLWANGRYRELTPAAGEPSIVFEGGADD